ncbi:MAG: NUDIX hydrolase [Verrucomicrobiales bacterium]|jgi:8-oxo-dGTP pyrophosphatase MutT (NUDIX family)|nr:NUDIX hydrolase [Verrucomicrobiales bacterium]
MPAGKIQRPAKRRPPLRSFNKAASVMAWIEDPYGQVLMVRQAYGKQLWALPGGKVKRKESLLGALKREILEETGHRVTHACVIDLFDRPLKGNFAILYRVLLKRSASARPRNAGEISTVAYHGKLPPKSTPSARFFWQRALTSFEPLSVIRKI